MKAVTYSTAALLLLIVLVCTLEFSSAVHGTRVADAARRLRHRVRHRVTKGEETAGFELPRILL